MRSNKIEFLPVEDEFKRKKTAERQDSRTPGELAEGYLKIVQRTDKKKDSVDNQQPVLKTDSSEG